MAPAVGEITRVSATEIQISWNTTEGVVDTYFVRYRQVQGIRRKRNAEDTAVVVETNETDYRILGLDPGTAYAVSVAAGNRAGRGNYSMEVTVGCESRGNSPRLKYLSGFYISFSVFDSSDFILHLSGAIVCVPWLVSALELSFCIV